MDPDCKSTQISSLIQSKQNPQLGGRTHLEAQSGAHLLRQRLVDDLIELHEHLERQVGRDLLELGEIAFKIRAFQTRT